MSLRRVYEMEFLISIPPKQYWEIFVDHMTRMSDKNLSAVTPFHEPKLIIESVDQETKTMKQGFTPSEFFEGYKLITATTKVIDEPSDLNSRVEISVEYDKSGPEIKDLKDIEWLSDYIQEMAIRNRVTSQYPVRLK